MQHFAEQEQYLRQLEAEGAQPEPSDLGEDMQLVIPVATYVIKTVRKDSGRKVFINVCHSEKVSPCSDTAGSTHRSHQQARGFLGMCAKALRVNPDTASLYCLVWLAEPTPGGDLQCMMGMQALAATSHGVDSHQHW